jgi:hypothetical protein
MGEWEWLMKWDVEGNFGAFYSTGGTERNAKYLPGSIRGLPEC